MISEDFHIQGIMAGRQLVAIFGILLLLLTTTPKADAGVNTYIESTQGKGKMISSFLSLETGLCFSIDILCLYCKLRKYTDTQIQIQYVYQGLAAYGLCQTNCNTKYRYRYRYRYRQKNIKV